MTLWPMRRIRTLRASGDRAPLACDLFTEAREGLEQLCEQVAVLAGVLKRPLHYEPLSDEAARTRMATDTPAPIIEAFFRFYSEGEFDDSIVLDTAERILGRPPRTFADWARAHAHAFRSA